MSVLNKCSFLVEILSFLKEVFSVFEKCQILIALFLFGKKYHFMQKVLVFGQSNECFSQHQFLCKTVNFLGKKIEILWEILTFSNNCSECEYLIGKHAYFQKILTFCVIVYIHQETRILIKTLIFLRKCLFVHVLIFIRVFLFLENCYFDSKYDFIRWHFGQKCHFSNKICISVGINSLEKSSNFLRKGVNLVVSFE